MNGDDYVLDGDLSFSNTQDAMKFYQSEYHKQKELISQLSRFIHQRGLGGQWVIWLHGDMK